jgi:hypothetical protein
MDNQPPAQPQAPTSEPAVEQQPQNSFASQSTQPTNQPYATKNNRNRLWIALAVISGLVLIAIIGAITIFNSSPDANATKFMQALKSSDDKSIQSLSDFDANDSFIVSAKNGLKDATYKLVSSTKKDSGYVVNFDVTGSSTIKDTSVTLKDNRVATFLLNTRTQAADIPKPAAIESSNTCLTLADAINTGESYFDDASIFNHAHEIPFYYDELFFEADSTAVSYGPALDELATSVANFYKATSNKKYQFQIIGSVNEATSTSAGKTLALQRAEKIKDTFIAAGVPESKIVIASPKNETSAANPEIYRRVNINIQTAAECDIAS